jgi:hypothetical protein
VVPDYCDLLIVGTGSLAESILHALAIADTNGPLRVIIGGRNKDRMRWLALSANARAATFESKTKFTIEPLDWTTPEHLALSLKKIQPRLVVQAASHQSFWNLEKADTAWAQLILRGGYGITLSLQCLLLLRVCQALASVGSEARIVNACYPDAVNPLLTKLGYQIETGIGNIAILASVFAAKLEGFSAHDFHMFAHHYHVSQWLKPPLARMSGPRVWLNYVESPDLGQDFRTTQLPTDASLNAITGCTSIPLLLALLGRRDYIGHAPGVLGLPGGYPISILDSKIAIRWPNLNSAQEMIEWNKSFQALDGVEILDEGYVRYPSWVQDELNTYAPLLAQGFAIDEIENTGTAMLQLRQQLSHIRVA